MTNKYTKIRNIDSRYNYWTRKEGAQCYTKSPKTSYGSLYETSSDGSSYGSSYETSYGSSRFSPFYNREIWGQLENCLNTEKIMRYIILSVQICKN